MMAAVHTIIQNWSDGRKQLVTSTQYSATGEAAIEGETIADSATDYQINIAIDVTAVVSFFMLSDQDITVETNNGGAPDDTISLSADIPYIWTTDSYDSFQLGTDVTALFITNASGSTATLNVRVIQDATP